MILRNVVNDFLTVLRQKYDDNKITFPHVLYHTLIYANRLKQQHIEKIDTTLYVHVFQQVEVNRDTDSKRKYIELPAPILNMDMDKGVNYITYDYTIDETYPAYVGVTFTRTTHAKVKVRYYTDDEKPNGDNPYFIVEHGRIYLLGIEDINTPFLEVGLNIAFNPNDYFTGERTLDEEWDFPEALLAVLQKQILDVGRFVLQIPKDILNEGADIQSEIPKTKILPVSQALNPQIKQQ